MSESSLQLTDAERLYVWDAVSLKRFFRDEEQETKAIGWEVLKKLHDLSAQSVDRGVYDLQAD